MPKYSIGERLVALCLVIAALYGASYQQYRHFDYDDPRGLNDSHSYVKMAQGNWDVTAIHRYRFVVPTLAGLICRGLHHCDVDSLILIFYGVNFCITLAASMLLYELLGRLGFKGPLPVVGVLLFVSSRVTVISTASPLVDSVYFLAIVAISYLLAARRFILLLALYPLLILTKETVVPFLFFPLLCREFRRRRNVLAWAGALVVSLIAFQVSRSLIGLAPGTHGGPSGSVTELLRIAFGHVRGSATHLFSLAGLHDLLNGFSLLLPMAVVGFYLDRKGQSHNIPGFLLMTLPIAAGYSFISGNLGRMMFASFVVVIPYALVVVERVFRGTEPLPPTSAHESALVCRTGGSD